MRQREGLSLLSILRRWEVIITLSVTTFVKEQIIFAPAPYKLWTTFFPLMKKSRCI